MKHSIIRNSEATSLPMHNRFWHRAEELFNRSGRFAALSSVLLLSSLTIIDCSGSNSTAISGYDSSLLTHKRIFLLLPDEGGIKLENPEAFAWSRGIGEAGAQGRVYSEFNTNLTEQLDSRYDSNTVLNYKNQSVGSIYPLDAVKDFSATSTPDAQKIDAARKEGAIDFLLVLNSIIVQNLKPREGEERGKETVTASFVLFDPAKKQTVKSGIVKISVDDPRVPMDTYVILARGLAKELPFLNRNY